MNRLLSTLIVMVALALATSGCSRPQGVQNHQLYVFGTLVDISLWNVSKEKGSEAVAEISTTFQTMHHDWHAWEPGPLVDVNKAIAAGHEVEVIPSLVPLIKESTVLFHQSEGLFNPAIGGLLNLWGFQSSEPLTGDPPPAKEKIEAWLQAAPGMGALKFEGRTLSSRNQSVQLDFGGFAKGVAVDRAIEILRSHGIDNAIVNAGGDLRAIGSKDGEPWRVGVRHPQGEGVLAAIEVMGDDSVFTSGNYERFNEYEGVRYAHILDPTTGWPVKGITSVTVIHNNSAVADAAATALVVAGVERWHRIAEQMGIKYVMLVTEDGAIHLNPAMRERVQFQGDVSEQLRISAPLKPTAEE